jgi:CHAT domain-containing protein
MDTARVRHRLAWLAGAFGIAISIAVAVAPNRTAPLSARSALKARAQPLARVTTATANDAPENLVLALVAADRALRHEPSKPEALFDRALALDALGLRFASAEAWRRFLDVDRGSSSAVEARNRLAIAEAPNRDGAWKELLPEFERALDDGDSIRVRGLVERFPEHARRWGEGVYLGGWGEELLRGDERAADRALGRARGIGAALLETNGEGLLADAVAAIEHADGLEQLAEGYRAYKQARMDYSARRVQEALGGFERAEQSFTAAQNPMELMAMVYRAHALVDLDRRATAEEVLNRVKASLRPTYRSLEVQTFWIESRIAADSGRVFDALIAATHSRTLSDRMGELDQGGRLRSAEAGMLARLGREHDAWQSRRAALAAAAESGIWQNVETAIEAIAWDELNAGHTDTAISLLDIQIAAPSTLPLTRFNAVLWRAYLGSRATGGAPDLAAAVRLAAAIPDPKQRADAMDELRLAEGLAAAATDPSTAEELFTQVIDSRTAARPADLPLVHYQRARTRRAIGNATAAEADLRRAVEMLEERGRGITIDTFKDTFLGNSSDIYEELAALLLDRGDWQAAFKLADQARSRLLLARSGGATSRLRTISVTVPSEVVGVHYTTFAGKTLVVAMDATGVEHWVVAAGRSRIGFLRDRMISAMLRGNRAGEERYSRTLYDLLLAPLQGRLTADRLLVIVPDDTTNGIPFVALRNAGGRYLIEQTAVAMAPSAAALTNTSVTVTPAKARATIVADPAFAEAVFPGLPRLPAARRDARTVSAIFPASTILSGAAAVPPEFRRSAVESDVIHIAAHALASPRDASLSLIALAATPGNLGVLYHADIEALDLSRHPLVVLAGCETGSLGGGKGSIRTLAHAFLAAGSSAVMATIWNVDDGASSAMTNAFYRSLAAGETAPAAVRETQLRFLRVLPTREWAAFRLYTGITQKGRRHS